MVTTEAPTATRRRRKAVVLRATSAPTSDRGALALVDSLGEMGVETVYLGEELNAGRVAAVVGEEGADAIELCLGGAPGIALLRDLLRELNASGRGHVSIVVHKDL